MVGFQYTIVGNRCMCTTEVGYKNMGLSYKEQTQVQKIWIKENYFVKQVVQNYNRWTDEEMISRGYYLDYDCGQYSFEHE